MWNEQSSDVRAQRPRLQGYNDNEDRRGTFAYASLPPPLLASRHVVLTPVFTLQFAPDGIGQQGTEVTTYLSGSRRIQMSDRFKLLLCISINPIGTPIFLSK